MQELQHVYDLLGEQDNLKQGRSLDELLTHAGRPAGGNILVRGISPTEMREGKSGESAIQLRPEARAELFDIEHSMLFEVLQVGPFTEVETGMCIEPGDLVTAPNNCPIPVAGSLSPGTVATLMPKAVGAVLQRANVLEACRRIAHDREQAQREAEDARERKRMEANGLNPDDV